MNMNFKKTSVTLFLFSLNLAVSLLPFTASAAGTADQCTFSISSDMGPAEKYKNQLMVLLENNGFRYASDETQAEFNFKIGRCPVYGCDGQVDMFVLFNKASVPADSFPSGYNVFGGFIDDIFSTRIKNCANLRKQRHDDIYFYTNVKSFEGKVRISSLDNIPVLGTGIECSKANDAAFALAANNGYRKDECFKVDMGTPEHGDPFFNHCVYDDKGFASHPKFLVSRIKCIHGKNTEGFSPNIINWRDIRNRGNMVQFWEVP